LDAAKARFRSDSNISDDGKDDDSIVHPTDPKSKTPFLRPLMVSGGKLRLRGAFNLFSMNIPDEAKRTDVCRVF
jgi:hypothetical protein